MKGSISFVALALRSQRAHFDVSMDYLEAAASTVASAAQPSLARGILQRDLDTAVFQYVAWPGAATGGEGIAAPRDPVEWPSRDKDGPA